LRLDLPPGGILDFADAQATRDEYEIWLGICNEGTGPLVGEARVSELWLSAHPATFAVPPGQRVPLMVRLHPERLGSSPPRPATLHLLTTAASVALPVLPRAKPGGGKAAILLLLAVLLLLALAAPWLMVRLAPQGLLPF
jgi:hypothetical protein